MRYALARLVLLPMLGGCSLIYNESNIPSVMPDAAAPPDMPIADVNPSMLDVLAVKSPPLLEGQGVGGSLPAVLVVTGHHILPEATIEVAPSVANASVMLTLGTPIVSIDGDWIAVPVTSGLMPTVMEAAGPIALTVKVTQMGFMDAETWELKPLDDLISATALTVNAPLKAQYSNVDVDGALTIAGSGPAELGIIRAVGAVRITGAVTAITDITPARQAAVAGGCSGGTPGSAGGCVPSSGGGATAGGGGGGGFGGGGMQGNGANQGAAGTMHGEPSITSYETNLAGGGGGGGGGISNGGVGGASGGRVEISAGGNLSVGTVTMNGTSGADAAFLSLGGAGGGGAGGMIVLRAGGSFEAGALSAQGAAGGTMPAAKTGGAGGAGRIRFDALGTTVTTTATPAAHRGLTIEPVTPPITRTKNQPLTVFGTMGDNYDVYVVNDGASTKIGDQTIANVTGMGTVTPTLPIGHNQICIVPTGVLFTKLEARNCIELAYLP